MRDAVLVFGVAVPLIVLGLLDGGRRTAGIEFGDVVFGLTGLTVLAWLLVAGVDRWMDAARPSGELFRNAGTDYARGLSRGRLGGSSRPARTLLVVTGTVVLGWPVLVATL